MRVHEMTPYAALQQLDDQLHEVLTHPGLTQADRASIVLARLKLSEVRRRHMPKMLPMDPATLPKGRVRVFTPMQGQGVGWLGEWEGGTEGAL